MSIEIQYSAKNTFRNGGKIKAFLDKSQLKELLPALLLLLEP